MFFLHSDLLGEKKCRMDCLATSVPEVKCTRCITMVQTKPVKSANQTICIHDVMKTPKAKLITAKKTAKSTKN